MKYSLALIVLINSELHGYNSTVHLPLEDECTSPVPLVIFVPWPSVAPFTCWVPLLTPLSARGTAAEQ